MESEASRTDKFRLVHFIAEMIAPWQKIAALINLIFGEKGKDHRVLVTLDVRHCAS